MFWLRRGILSAACTPRGLKGKGGKTRTAWMSRVRVTLIAVIEFVSKKSFHRSIRRQVMHESSLLDLKFHGYENVLCDLFLFLHYFSFIVIYVYWSSGCVFCSSPGSFSCNHLLFLILLGFHPDTILESWILPCPESLPLHPPRLPEPSLSMLMLLLTFESSLV